MGIATKSGSYDLGPVKPTKKSAYWMDPLG